jgi:HIRAN domain-containing protein
MADLLHRIPVVAGLAYVERVRRLPSSFTAALVPEPDNRYFQTAVAVVVGGEKVGYLAPEISRRYFAPLVAHTAGDVVSCPGRRGTHADHESSGVEILLDFSALPIEAVE